ncbi:DUF6679 family protein [Candidatus Synechococcus spongiarum]|uniref:Uncharacterized protein n=2 Tax=Candidatus Synechococcus spongiarum TaxID=431041 RepID=A0A1T1CNF5_9SYNE|nr:DUF6679 family protein [Candidatus Synechococcus spongiarum]OOV30080.1 hypothetical protein BV61_05765 [Candidatus Synechococcus spongiarum LMB bulk15M]OOV31100.1 hypothetical protein BV53_07575 [Candidatus Synechococcus spongiarum LMB bulk15N]
MFDRKLYEAQCDGRPVWVFLSDQQRWIEQAEVVEVSGGVVTLRYETDEDGELQAWQEMVRLNSVGSVMSRLSSVSRNGTAEDLLTAEDCPVEEQISQGSPDGFGETP